MESGGWEETHRSLIARSAALAGIAYVVISFLPGTLGGPLFDNVSTSQILDWVKHNNGAISLQGFMDGLGATLLALLLLVLVAVSNRRGLFAAIATSATGAFMAVNWVHAGVFYALADASQRGQADAGIVALFSLAKTLTFADGFVFGVAVIAVSSLAMQSRALPSPLVWLGLVVGAYYLVSPLIQLAINQSAGGVTGPIGVVLALLWILAVAVVLLIKPIWRARPATSVAATAS